MNTSGHLLGTGHIFCFGYLGSGGWRGSSKLHLVFIVMLPDVFHGMVRMDGSVFLLWSGERAPWDTTRQLAGLGLPQDLVPRALTFFSPCLFPLESLTPFNWVIQGQPFWGCNHLIGVFRSFPVSLSRILACIPSLLHVCCLYGVLTWPMHLWSCVLTHSGIGSQLRH